MLGKWYPRAVRRGRSSFLTAFLLRGDHQWLCGRNIVFGAMLLMLMLAPLASFAQENWNIFSRLERRVRNLEEKVLADSIRISEYGQKTFYLFDYLNLNDSLEPRLHFSGYVDAYCAMYSDSVSGEYQKFPTSAPRSNQLGLNMLYLAGNYSSKHARANVGLQLGDIASSAWSEKYNLIQEANVGLRLHKRLWLDGGFFRTHLGMESIQPRENITHSIAVTTYFEPYFLSGVKLSYSVTDKLLLQVSGFNGFNTYVETNRNKTLGATVIYFFSDKSALTINSLYCDESPTGQAFSKKRLYNDIFFVHRGPKVELGAEANYGTQTHSDLQDSTESAFMYSFILACKYKFAKGRFGVYGRGEMFEDSNEILTGPVLNANHTLVGINLVGGTLGVEWKPMPQSFLRMEGRRLQTTANEDIFYQNGRYYHYRWEGIAALGVWF